MPPIGWTASLISAPGSSAEAGIQAVVVALFLLAFGFLIADVLAGGRELDLIACLGLSLPALAAYACALMLLHIGAGGWVFHTAWAVRGLTLAVAGSLLAIRLRRRRAGTAPDLAAILAAAVMAVAAMALWGTRVFQVLPITQGGGGDIPWHLGLATQLLTGERTPSAPVTGDIPNFYPWLYHSVVALTARFTPGGRAVHALGPLQLVLVGGMALSLFALGRELTGQWLTGGLATLLGSVGGAFGSEYPGGFSRRPYNVAFLNAAPPLPRDLALALLGGFLLLTVAGVRRRRPEILAAGGAVLGLAGLAGAEAFLVGLGVAVVLTVFPPAIPRRTVAGTLILPAVAVYLLWLAPLALNYLRLGGFVNITQQRPAVLTPAAILVAWGVATPLAILGLVRWLPRGRLEPPARIALVLLGVTGGLVLLAALIPSGLGQGFLALGRRHRYWPLLHLAVGLYGAVGGTELLHWARRWHPAVAGLVATIVVAVALPSTIRPVFNPPPKPVTLLTEAMRGDADALLNVVAPSSDHRCVAAVPPSIAIWTFAYTGYRLVLFRWPGYKTNLARIRWREIYEHIPGDAERVSDNAALTQGTADPATWQALVDKYGVDVVVAPIQAAEAAPFDELAGRTANTQRGEYVVLRLTACNK